jgi:glycosyltransferase involved in cell wall biosynthesis
VAAAPKIVDAVIPARNAAATLAAVMAALPRARLRSVVVVDRCSSDDTALVARDGGALCLRAPHDGYGAACLTALAHLSALPTPPDVVLFVGGDALGDARQAELLLAPLLDDRAELAVATHRRRFAPTEIALMRLIGAVFAHRFEGLGPSRAIRFPALVALGMRDEQGGWDVEMLVRSLKLGLDIAEIRIDGRASTHTPAARSLLHIVRHATLR